MKKKKSSQKESLPDTKIVQESNNLERTHFNCPTCQRQDTKILGITPEGLTVCEGCGYKKVDKNGVERVYLKLVPDVVLTRKEDRE